MVNDPERVNSNVECSKNLSILTIDQEEQRILTFYDTDKLLTFCKLLTLCKIRTFCKLLIFCKILTFNKIPKFYMILAIIRAMCC